MISVVIPTYNRKDRLSCLLADVFKQEDVEVEVIVVDDNSTDGTDGMITAEFPQVAYLRNSFNRGPTVSRNLGIRRARGQIVVGFDSDVSLPDRKTLARTEKVFAKTPGSLGVAFRVLDGDSLTDDVPRWWHARPLPRYADEQFETDYFSGTAFAFRTNEVLKVGAFPEDIFQYYEEVELAYRFLDARGVILYIPELCVLHHPGSRSSGWSDHRMFHHPRSIVLFTLGCYPFYRGLVYLLPRLANALLKALVSRRVLIFLRAMLSAAKAAPARLRNKKALQPATWNRIAHLRDLSNTTA